MNKTLLKLHTRRKRKGFSLLEAIIALFILTISVLALIRVSFTEHKASQNSRHRLEALVIAENYLELLRAGKDGVEFNDTDGLKAYTIGLGFDDKSGLYEKIDIHSNFEYNVKVYIDSEEEKLVQIVVEVKPYNTNAVRVGTKLFLQ